MSGIWNYHGPGWRAEWFRKYGSLYCSASVMPFDEGADEWELQSESSMTTDPSPWHSAVESILQVLEDDGASPTAAREHTLEEVAAIIGVSRERVRQIEAKALRKIRKKLSSVLAKDLARELGDPVDEGLEFDPTAAP